MRVSAMRAFLVMAFVATADLLSKHAINGSLSGHWRVREFWAWGGSVRVYRAVSPQVLHLLPGLDLVDLHNPGILGGSVPAPPVAILILIVATMIRAVVRELRAAHPMPHVWLWSGLLLGGAIGNIAEECIRGSVTDFIGISLPFVRAATNLADIALIAGAIGLMKLKSQRTTALRNDIGRQPEIGLAHP